MRRKFLQSILFLLILETLVVSGDRFGYLSSGLQVGAASRYLNGMILFLSICTLLMLVSIVFHPVVRSTFHDWFERAITQPKVVWWGLLGSALLLYETAQDLLFLNSEIPGIYYQGYIAALEEYFSILVLIFLISIQLLLVLVVYNYELIWKRIKTQLSGPWVLPFLILAAGLLFINLSRANHWFAQPGENIFQPLNTPLSGFQVFFLLVIFVIGSRASSFLRSKYGIHIKGVGAEILISIVIWLAAFSLWTATPNGPNPFVDIERPPTGMLAPASDALYFEIQAHQVVSGEGFDNNFFPRHPMYIQFLSFLHLLAGDNYLNVVRLQVAFLSLIPVLLYKLASLLKDRSAGMIVALLYIFRERTALFLSDQLTISTSKTLMSEPFSILWIILSIFLFVKWLKTPRRNLSLPLLLGSAVGIALLVRVEIMVFIPVLILVSLVYLWDQRDTWLTGLVLSMAACLVMITPWMVRNQRVLGNFAIDYHFQYKDSIKEILDLFRPEGNSLAPSSDRNITKPGGVSRVTFSNPSDLSLESTETLLPQQADSLNFTSFINHTSNNLVLGIYYLPSNHQPLLTVSSVGDLLQLSWAKNDPDRDSFQEKYYERYIKSLPYWSTDWDGVLVARSILPLLLTTAILAVGLSGHDRYGKMITGLMILMYLAYAAALGFLGYSISRFLALIDWMGLFFYGVGLSTVLKSTIHLPIPDHKGTRNQVSSGLSRKRQSILVAISGLLTVMIGASLYYIDQQVPAQYTAADLQKITADLDGFSDARANIDEELALKNKEMVVSYGKALYPRYFASNEALFDDRRGTLPDKSYSRLEFYVVGTQNGWVTLPGNQESSYFPHGSEIIVIGSLQPPGLDATGKMISGEYLLAEQVFILPGNTQDSPVQYECQGSICFSKEEPN